MGEQELMMDTAEGERLRRWRLVLGEEAQASCGLAGLSPEDRQMDEALAALYEADSRHSLRGGSGASSPRVARWLGDIRRFFPSSVVQVMQKDAFERLNLHSMLLQPEMLESVQPDVNLVSTLMSLRGIIPEKTKETARLVVRKVVDALYNAERPLLFGGGGVIMSNASEEFRNLAKNLSIPVTCSLMGLGAFPCDHPQWLGMLGMHGTYAANKAVSNADLLIAVGVRFDDRVTGRLSSFAPKATIVHIDIDPTSIHKNVNVRIPVVGDCRNSLIAIREHLAAREPLPWKERFAAWQGQLDEWKQEQPITWTPGETTIKPQEVIKAVDKITEGKAILTTEVGQHQMWAAQLYNFTEPRTLLTSGGLGTMGYGFPAAIGAQFAYPNKLVIDVSGDGSFQMNLQELITAVSNKLPVKVLLLNNGCLGMVRQLQDLFYGGRLNAVDIPDQPDFVKLAEAYGAEGYRVAKLEDLESTLRTAFASPNTAIIDVIVERDENVYPTVPSGASLDEMLLL